MENLEKLCLELLKQIGIGHNISKMYPPGHPTYDRVAESAVEIQLKFPVKYRTISFYFFENMVLFEDLRIDISKVTTVLNLSKQFFRTKIESISIDRDATKEDWKAFFEVLSLPLKKFEETDDPTEFLLAKGVERIRFNEIKFSLSSAGSEKEVKFDLDSILRELEKAENPEEVIKNVPGNTIGEKVTNIIKGTDKLNPVSLSKLFNTLSREGTPEDLLSILEDEEIKNKIRELMEEMDENDFILLLSSVPYNKRGEILAFIPEDKKENVLKRIPSFVSGDERGSDLDRKIDELINKFDELKDEEKEREIRDLFLRMAGVDIKESFGQEKINDLVSAVKIVAYYLLEKYGEEGFSGLTLIVSQVLKILAPELKERFISESEKYSELARSIRKVLDEMSDEELISLMSGVEEKGGKLPDTIKEIIEKRRFHGKGEFVSARDKEIEMLERVTREKHLVVTGEKKLKFLEKELEEGIGASELETVTKPLIEKIEKGDENERTSAVQALTALALSFLNTDKVRPLEYILEIIKNKVRDEEHPAVIFSYIEGLEKIVDIAKQKKQDHIVEEIQRTFRDLLDSEAKKKLAIRALGKIGTDFALRMLLTALWDEETEEDVKEALISSGREGFEALKSIFPEVENMAVRRRIAKILAGFPSEMRKEFYENLEEKTWKAQRDICFILGESKDQEGLELLIKLLKTGQDIVRVEALRALAKIGDSKVEDDILEVYSEFPSKDVREECIRTLVKIGTEKSLLAVISYLNEAINSGEFKPDLFIPSLNFVFKHNPQKVYPLIEKILFERTFLKKPKYPSHIRTEVIRLISRYRTNKNKEILEKLLNDPDGNVKLAATLGLKKLENA